MTPVADGRTTGRGGRCRYCGISIIHVRIGREDLGAFNKPGLVAMVCEICDRFLEQPHHPETPDGTEPELQES